MEVLTKAEKLSQAESIILRISSGDKLAEQELVNIYYRGLMLTF